MSNGLANLGNTCSINTLIQCIGHCDRLRDYLLYKASFQKKENKQFSIGAELSLLLKQLWVDHQALKPVRFLKALQEIIEFSIGQEQMDFTEVWMVLVQCLLEESHEPSFQSNLYGKSYSEEIQTYLYSKALQEWEKHTINSNSPMLDIVQGVQVQQIECQTCHRYYHNVEPFQWTYLDLPLKGSASFEQCLHSVFEKDQVNGWKCDRCHQSSNEKVIRFWKLPDIWIFLLKRFDGMKKNSIPFECPAVFELPNHVEMGGSSTSEYRLKSIAQHYGSIHGGHYNAICLDKDRWMLYDDLHSQEVSLNHVISNNPNVYGLFYERVY